MKGLSPNAAMRNIFDEMFHDMQLARVRDLHGEVDFDQYTIVMVADARRVRDAERAETEGA
jgi:hypothetical protein